MRCATRQKRGIDGPARKPQQRFKLTGRPPQVNISGLHPLVVYALGGEDGKKG